MNNIWFVFFLSFFFFCWSIWLVSLLLDNLSVLLYYNSRLSFHCSRWPCSFISFALTWNGMRSRAHFGPFKFAPLSVSPFFQCIRAAVGIYYATHKIHLFFWSSSPSPSTMFIRHTTIDSVRLDNNNCIVVHRLRRRIRRRRRCRRRRGTRNHSTELKYILYLDLFLFVCNSRMEFLLFSLDHFLHNFVLFRCASPCSEIIYYDKCKKFIFIQLPKHPVLVVFDVLLRSYSLALCMFWL